MKRLLFLLASPPDTTDHQDDIAGFIMIVGQPGIHYLPIEAFIRLREAGGEDIFNLN